MTGRAGAQLHVHQVGALVRIVQEGSRECSGDGTCTNPRCPRHGITWGGGEVRRAPAVELVWPGRDAGDELPADPGVLDDVARQLAAAAEVLRT